MVDKSRRRTNYSDWYLSLLNVIDDLLENCIFLKPNFEFQTHSIIVKPVGMISVNFQKVLNGHCIIHRRDFKTNNWRMGSVRIKAHFISHKKHTNA